MRSRAPTDKIEKHPPLTNSETTPSRFGTNRPGGSGATPVGALARTHRQDKNPPDDSVRIARGLRGSCRVHKPGVPRGSASTPGLGPGEQHVVRGPTQESKNTTGRKDSSVADRKVCPKEQNARSSTSLALLSDRSTRFGRQLPPDDLSNQKGLAQNAACYSDPVTPTGDP